MSKSIYKLLCSYIGLVLFVGCILLVTVTQVMVNKAQNYTHEAYSKTQCGVISSVFDHEKRSLNLLIKDYAVWDDMYYSIESNNYKWSRANATKFLVEDETGYDIDIVHVFGTKNNYSEAYGDMEILALIMEAQVFKNTVKKNDVLTDFIKIKNRVFLVAVSPVTTNNKKMSNGFYLLAKEYTDEDVNFLVSQYSNRDEYYGLGDFSEELNEITPVNFALRSENGEKISEYTFLYNLKGYDQSYSKLIGHTLSIIILVILAIGLGLKHLKKEFDKGKTEVIYRLEHLMDEETGETKVEPAYKELEEIMLKIKGLDSKIRLRDKSSLRHHMDTLTVIIDAIEEKDEFTKGHSRRVMKYAEIIAQHLAIEDVTLLKKAALLHDIGKITLPAEILNKPNLLTSEEYDLIKTHTQRGQWILNAIPRIENIGVVIRQHHERVDGRGYPDGLSGDEINMFARIIALSDAFDAMTSDRAYRKKKEFYEAVQIIKKETGKQFDERVVNSFLESLQQIKVVILEEEEITQN